MTENGLNRVQNCRRRYGLTRVSLLFALYVLSLIAVAPASMAQTETILELYTVYNIQVDVSARTAAQARERALEQAETRAFWILLNKIAISEDLQVLPEMSGDEIRGYVRSMEILEEHSSRRRYRATLDITFEPPTIRVLMGTSGIRFSEISTSPLLVLPVWREAGTDYLFEDGNLWLQAWRNADLTNWLTPFILPRGDFEDRNRLTARNVSDTRKEATRAYIKQAYGVETVFVVRARRSEDGSGIKRLSYELSGKGDAEPLTAFVMGTADQSWDQLLLEAVSHIQRLLDNDWKRQTLTAFGEFNQLNVRIQVDRIEDWLEFTRGLQAISIVRDVSPVRLALPWSELKILYLGTYEQLQLALEQANLRLIRIEGGFLLKQGEPR